MKQTLLSLLILALVSGYSSGQLKYVNPFIGTDRMGHTYPGATVPFGMVQLSPDTDTVPYEMNGRYNRDVYKYCAGYQYADSTIVGFSHTHFSGTGHSDLGDILLMPTTGPGIARLVCCPFPVSKRCVIWALMWYMAILLKTSRWGAWM